MTRRGISSVTNWLKLAFFISTDSTTGPGLATYCGWNFIGGVLSILMGAKAMVLGSVLSAPNYVYASLEFMFGSSGS